MNLSKSMLRRLGRANPKKPNRSLSPAEILRDAPPSPMARIELARRAAEAEAQAAKAAAPPEPTETTAKPANAKPTDTRPPAPQTPPPEPQWWEEKCRWRPRGAADGYDDEEYYETIHRYDPLEWALEEEDYDWDS